MQWFALIIFELLNLLRHFPEGSDCFALQNRYHVFLDGWNVIISQKERIPAACPRILDCGAVAVGNLPVVQDQLDRNALSTLANGCTSWRGPFAIIGRPIFNVFASPDGPLIIEIKARRSFTQNILTDLHSLPLP